MATTCSSNPYGTDHHWIDLRPEIAATKCLFCEDERVARNTETVEVKGGLV